MAMPTFHDAADVVHDLPRIQAQVMEAALRESVVVVRTEIRAEAPRGATGRLQRAVTSRITGRGLKTVGKVRAGGFANVLIGGAKPHRIPGSKGLRKKALSWGGAQHPSAHAQHPGIHPDPFVRRGIDAAMPQVDAIFAEAGARVVRLASQTLRARGRRR